MRKITVDLGPRSYDVIVGAGLLAHLGATVAALGRTSHAVVISDSTVVDLYGPQAAESLAGANLAGAFISFPAGEANKTLAVYGKLLDDLLALTPAVDRDCVIVALGGGVPGDVAGFVAATALRGLRVVQCPTTLLAAVDSSVGGKTGVDHATGKNLIGAFHQPGAVVIDVETFRTLPAGELANGLAECVKHGVIRDEPLLGFIEDNAGAIGACNGDVMEELVARNVAIKAAVVADDERETGQRAHLNFGHTIGHAIEVFVGYDKIAHGQAVGRPRRVAPGKAGPGRENTGPGRRRDLADHAARQEGPGRAGENGPAYRPGNRGYLRRYYPGRGRRRRRGPGPVEEART